jgi:fatty-acid desaturase
MSEVIHFFNGMADFLMNRTSYFGLLDLSLWQMVMVTLVLTQVTILSVTLYLHRHSAHSALDLHPVLSHFFRFWLWLATGTVTKEWTAVHRKHHAKCETEEDPHSPVVKGLDKVFFQGAELYKQEARTPETLTRYGQRTPEDWIERNLYTKHRSLGITLMALIDLTLFGVAGITIWAVQMIWIPLFAAGVINGIGHAWGYRNFECKDNARNLTPLALFIGGEELHNNHHTYPNSARLAVKPWEVDIGWCWIRLFQFFGLAKARHVTPIARRVAGKSELTTDTLMAITNHRFQIMADYKKRVLVPMLKEQQRAMEKELLPLYRKAKKLLSREESLVKPAERSRIQQMLDNNPHIRLIYEKNLELQAIWRRSTGLKLQDKLNILAEWCHQAEASGIESLQEFAKRLKSYSLSSATA